MSNTPNTDTLEDQAKAFYHEESDFDFPWLTMADFARQVAKEAVRRREIEIADDIYTMTEDAVREYSLKLKQGSE